jgi:hypothetical protein
MTVPMPDNARSWLHDLSLIVVLIVAAGLRFTGARWGELQYQHPDEVFLGRVASNLRAHACVDAEAIRARRFHARVPVDACPPDRRRWLTLAEFFDTGTSPLNPNNRGAPFYVYGTLPLFLVRYIYELLPPGTTSITLLGRRLAGLADVSAILIFYFVVSRIYARRTALLAASFSALAVMQIQQSHFFTVDSFTNPFLFLALYFAVKIAYDPTRTSADQASSLSFASIPSDVTLWNSAFFGMGVGLAASCKLSAAAVAVVLPAALALRFFDDLFRRRRPAQRTTEQSPSRAVRCAFIVIYLLAGGLLTLATLRIFQPYAFIGFRLNPRWISNLWLQYAQATGAVDLPWNLQWVRRSHLYSFVNLTVWGLGLPLGVLAWAGFFSMAWRILKGERKHILLWAWTAFYFGWQSLQFNPTMRYQLPIYPLLCMMAAWVASECPPLHSSGDVHRGARRLASAIGGLVLIATGIWAVAFVSIYTRAEPRIAASRWIYQNIPGAASLGIRTAGGSIYNQPLSMPSDTLEADKPLNAVFVAQRDGAVIHVALPHVANTDHSTATLAVSIFDRSSPSSIRQAAGTITSPFAATTDPRGQPATLTLEPALQVERGRSYSVSFRAKGATLRLVAATVANETDYDWSLPFRLDDYEPFGGIYRGDLNLQLYWNDDAAKLVRMERVLDQADYIFVPTNHQYAQITRVPERYPLTTIYYRELLGCPPDRDIIWCYRVAEPGTFTGRLGFDLVKTFESYPTLGPLVINDQAAEEAFTFYDHPKVLIFQKRPDFDLAQVRAVLQAQRAPEG